MQLLPLVAQPRERLTRTEPPPPRAHRVVRKVRASAVAFRVRQPQPLNSLTVWDALPATLVYGPQTAVIPCAPLVLPGPLSAPPQLVTLAAKDTGLTICASVTLPYLASLARKSPRLNTNLS